MPVMLVHSPITTRVARRYYCLPCWDYLLQRASADIPDLTKDKNAKASAEHIGVLLGIIEPNLERPDTQGRGYLKEDAGKDMRLEIPVEFLGSRVPFERWYPKGAELEAHIARVTERLTGEESKRE